MRIFPAGQPEELAAHLLVVYNTNDPDSKGLASYYAAKRAIPPERVLAISCPVTEEITRAQYDATIRTPITTYLVRKNWMMRQTQQVRVGNRSWNLLVATHNDIWAIVLMRGVPLKIAPDPSDEDSIEPTPELQTNAAAVDSELALLPVFGLPKGGYIPNVFFDAQPKGMKRVGPELARNIILVTRLDGPQPSDVRRMIDDCLNAEKNRLAGLAVVDTRGKTDVKDGYTSGDIWLRGARDMLVRDGWDVKFDNKPDVLPATDPCNHVAIYLGWYHDGAIGPWVTPPNRFVRGAIAYHLHSFSASTVRSETSNWVGPLIAHGADATMGMVYEPYLALTPHEDIFTRRLLQGDYFAEAAYASERGLSWMLTVVGDPLYRPFRLPLDSALAGASVPHTESDDWLLLQKVQREIVAGRIEARTDSLEQALDVPGAGPVAEERLGDLLEKLSEVMARAATEQAYQKALAAETVPVDRIRVGLKLAQYYSNHGQDEQAQSRTEELCGNFIPQDAERFRPGRPIRWFPRLLHRPILRRRSQASGSDQRRFLHRRVRPLPPAASPKPTALAVASNCRASLPPRSKTGFRPNAAPAASTGSRINRFGRMGQDDEHGAAEFLVIRKREDLQVSVDFLHPPVLDHVLEPGEDLGVGIFRVLGPERPRRFAVVVQQQTPFQLTAGVEDFGHPHRVRVLRIIEKLADDDVLLIEMDPFPHEAERAGQLGHLAAVVQLAKIPQQQLDLHIAFERLVDLDQQLDGLGKIGNQRVKFFQVIVGLGQFAELETDFSRLQKRALGLRLLGQNAVVNRPRLDQLAPLLQGIAFLKTLLIFRDFRRIEIVG